MAAAIEELVREGMDRLAAVVEVPPGLAGRACAAVPQRALGGQALPMGLGDLFFDPDDPLHPDLEEDEDEDD